MSNQKALLSFSLILAVIAIGVSGYAIYQNEPQEHDHTDLRALIETNSFDWQDNTEFWTFVNDNFASQADVDIVDENAMTMWLDQEDRLGEIIVEVVKNKVAIKENHPATGNVAADESQEVSGTTPILTMKVEKSEYTRGETITITGSADMSGPVFFTIYMVDSTMTAATTVGETATYVVDIPIEFDATQGTWKIWATQGKERSDTIVVEVSD